MDEKLDSAVAFNPDDPEYELVRRFAEEEGISPEEMNRQIISDWQTLIRRDGGSLILFKGEAHGTKMEVEVIRHSALWWSVLTSAVQASASEGGARVPIRPVVLWSLFLGGDLGDAASADVPVVPSAIVEQVKARGYRLVGGEENAWSRPDSANVRRVSAAMITEMADEVLSMPTCVAEAGWDHVGAIRFLEKLSRVGFQFAIERGLDERERYRGADGQSDLSFGEFLKEWRNNHQNTVRRERLRGLNDALRSVNQKERLVDATYRPPLDVLLPSWLPRERWGVEHPTIERIFDLACYFQAYPMEAPPGARLVLGIAGHPSKAQVLTVAKEAFGVRDDLGVMRAEDKFWKQGLGYMLTLEVGRDGSVVERFSDPKIAPPIFALYDFERGPRILVDEVLIEELLKVYGDSGDPRSDRLPYQYGTIFIGKQEARWLASDTDGPPTVVFIGEHPGSERDGWYVQGLKALFEALAQPTKLIILEPEPLPKKKSVLRRLKKEGKDHLRPLRALLWLEGKTYRPLEIFKPAKPSEPGGGRRKAHFVRGHLWLCPYGPRRSQRELRWRRFHTRGVGDERGRELEVKKVNVEDIPGVIHAEDKK